ncbi:hypothetical protein CCP4SC76_2080001 [Gammaproteobacteria bacterium]
MTQIQFRMNCETPRVSLNLSPIYKPRITLHHTGTTQDAREPNGYRYPLGWAHELPVQSLASFKRARK